MSHSISHHTPPLSSAVRSCRPRLRSANATRSSPRPIRRPRHRQEPGAASFRARSIALPLGSVRPAGWLRRQLEIQANGLSGHLDETWPDVGPNSGWLGGTGESWERGPYYLDGLIPLAWLLDDARLKAKAQKYIDWILTHQAPNGMIGPASNDDWWPRIVALKALTQYQEFTGDPRVIPLMDRYFRYQLAELPKRPLRDWGKFRWQDELLSVIWLYNRTGVAVSARPRAPSASAGLRLDGAVCELPVQAEDHGRVHQAQRRRRPQGPRALHARREQWAGGEDRADLVARVRLRRPIAKPPRR